MPKEDRLNKPNKPRVGGTVQEALGQMKRIASLRSQWPNFLKGTDSEADLKQLIVIK